MERTEIGARRRLSDITIAADGTMDKEKFDISGAGTRDGLRALLLAAGQWPAIRSRPFERIADPGATPIAIFVTAIDTAPHAPDPVPIIEARHDDFTRGLDAVALLADCPVYLCQPDVAPFAEGSGRRKTVRFAGAHPAGLVGTHIARLCVPGDGEAVWHIGTAHGLQARHGRSQNLATAERRKSVANGRRRHQIRRRRCRNDNARSTRRLIGPVTQFRP